MIFIPSPFKHSYVFIVRNKSASGGDYQVFDITDDETGQLHSKARLHIPPFINETVDLYTYQGDTKNNITHAKNIIPAPDCTGTIHYLLGRLDRPLRIPSDGHAIELFTDYGIHYEPVRHRKGY